LAFPCPPFPLQIFKEQARERYTTVVSHCLMGMQPQFIFIDAVVFRAKTTLFIGHHLKIAHVVRMIHWYAGSARQNWPKL
jgi:hypothetical protein